MPAVREFKTNFTAGELSPLLYARVDIDKYPNACEVLTNFVVQRYGGIRKRGGTEYINSVKTAAKKTRVVQFVYSVTQAYILEFGDLYVRVYANGGRVGTVEVTTPYTQDDIFDLQFAQSADVLYIAHPDYAPRQFTRTAATTFTMTTVDFVDGPYLDINEGATTLKPAKRAAIHNIMTTNTAPSDTVASADASADAFKVFDGDLGSGYADVSDNTGYISYTFDSGTKVADAYWIKATTNVDKGTPTSWQFQGYTGSAWVTLDARDGEPAFSRGERRFYEFENKTAFSAYRLIWTGTDVSASTQSDIAEMGWHEEGSSQTPFNLTASSATGINGGSGFLTTDVGRMIRLLGADGQWRWAQIAARTSSTVVTVRLYGHALPDLTPIINWQMGAWSDETGWPASVGFFNGRLCWARTAEQPQTVWMSRVNDFTNHGVSDPLVDDDAINVTIFSEQLNEIKWISEASDLFVGTSSAIRTIGANSATGPFSPTNIQQKRQTTVGAGDLQPVQIGNVGIYTSYYRNDVREIAYSFQSDSYVSQDLSILAEHIPRAGVKEIAYSQNPISVLWFVKDDGTLGALTYERDQQVIAFHNHVLGGNGVTVESVESIPGTGRDEIWLVVKRMVNGSAVRYLERLSVGLSDTDDIKEATFLDCHLTYSGSSTTTLSGLSHLQGESVYVWSDAGKQGPYTVSAGAITLGAAVTNACVGYMVSSVMETLSPEAGAAGGTAQTRIGRSSEIFVRLNRSQGGKIGPSDGTLEDIPYDDDSLFSGDARVPIEMSWQRGKRLRLTHDEPTPFHVLGLISELKVNG